MNRTALQTWLKIRRLSSYFKVGLSWARLSSFRTLLNASIVLMLDLRMRSVISDSTSPELRSALTYSPNILWSGLPLSTVMYRFSAKVRISFVTKVCSRSRPASGSFFSMESRTALARTSKPRSVHSAVITSSASTGALCWRRRVMRSHSSNKR